MTREEARDIKAKDGAGIVARVTATHRDRYAITCEKGKGYARLKSGSYRGGDEAFPTTGDYVRIDWQEAGDSRVLATLPRRTVFVRSDPFNAYQTVAANFDYVFIMQSLNQDFNPRRLERYLALAWQSGAEPVVILTKADIAVNGEEKRLQAEELAAGSPVYVVSAKTGMGVEDLQAYLAPGKTLVFLGSSGVGKSSLVNALAGQEIMSTAEIREDDGKGRHTTTYRQLVELPSGAMIIDTPGMREMGMWEATEGLGRSFSDIEELLGRCKFSDCTHRSEPGCAILAAIRTGELSQDRYESYRKLENEVRRAEDRRRFLHNKRLKSRMIAANPKGNGK